MSNTPPAPHGERPLTVLAYDHTGNARVAHEIRAGDHIDWKRNGSRGTFYCAVQQVWRSPSGRTLLQVALLKHDGVPLDSAPPRRITSAGVSRVYDMQGNRKEPVRQ